MVLSPGVDVGFVNDARQRFVGASAYLDDRPAAPLRFLAEANLTLMVRRQEEHVDREESRSDLRDRIRAIFTGPTFELIPFAAGPEDVGDDIGDSRPRLVLIGYDAEAVSGDGLQIPSLVERIFRTSGIQGNFRLQNNLVFLVAVAQQQGRRRPGRARSHRVLTEELALRFGLSFRALAPMRSRTNIRGVAEGIDAMAKEEAACWLGMSMHRRPARGVSSRPSGACSWNSAILGRGIPAKILTPIGKKPKIA